MIDDNKQTNSVALIYELTIRAEWLPLVGEGSPKFGG
jgi:hypothetical protein